MSDIKKINLLPCPFCHGLEDGKLIGEPIVEFQDGYVACNNLNCFIYYVETTKEAWNTRPTNDAKAMIYNGLRELSWVDTGHKSLADLIDDELWSGGGSLTVSIIQTGRRDAMIGGGGSFSSQDMLDALKEVCKPNDAADNLNAGLWTKISDEVIYV